MEDKYINDQGVFEYKLTRSQYVKFVSFFKELTGLSIDKCFSDSDEDYFELSIDVINTDLPF